MAHSEYTPRPLEIAHVELNTHIYDLIEILARHAHDLWAKQRIKEGWSWGKHRCDQHKTNPCLIPYEELPEDEKEYDRQVAMGTIKAIVALGYTITEPQTSMVSDD